MFDPYRPSTQPAFYVFQAGRQVVGLPPTSLGKINRLLTTSPFPDGPPGAAKHMHGYDRHRFHTGLQPEIGSEKRRKTKLPNSPNQLVKASAAWAVCSRTGRAQPHVHHPTVEKSLGGGMCWGSMGPAQTTPALRTSTGTKPAPKAELSNKRVLLPFLPDQFGLVLGKSVHFGAPLPTGGPGFFCFLGLLRWEQHFPLAPALGPHLLGKKLW